jgi:hypothetical protein
MNELLLVGGAFLVFSTGCAFGYRAGEANGRADALEKELEAERGSS